MLLEHNIPVYEELKEALKESNKAIIVTTMGTGKTYLSLQYLEDNNLNALVVCPKTSICSEWRLLSNNIEVITYNKFIRLKDYGGYDCYIFDEVHHAGSPVWGKAVVELMESTNKPVIGLTANPKRYTDGKNVAELLFENNIVNGYSFLEAIQKEILPKMNYIRAMYSPTELINTDNIEKVDGQLIKKLDFLINKYKIDDILKKHMPKKHKCIVFVDSIYRLYEARKIISDMYPDDEMYIIHSKLTNKANEKIKEDFKCTINNAFLFAVDMANEGLHIEGTNSIVMFRKTRSPQVYMQQLGRCSDVNAVDIAVVFDIVDNKKRLKLESNNIAYSTKSDIDNNHETKHDLSDQIIVEDYAQDIVDVLDEINTLLSNRWTEEEDNIIREYYPTEGCNVYKRLSGRTKSSCAIRANKLNIKYINYWTEEEDNIIIEYYPTEGCNVYKRLPDRTKSSCAIRANKLNIKRDNRWTEEEDAILKKYYPIECDNVYKRLPGRTKKSCMGRANKLNIKYINYWTEEEDAILIEYYPTEGCNVYKRLPDRTKSSCTTRAVKLNIKRDNKWTEEEDNILREYYPTEGCNVYKRLPGRTKKSCMGRVNKLNIRKG